MQAQTPEVSAEKATTPPAVDDRTIYECTGCGTVTRDRAAQMALYKRAGALSCCPERKMVPVQLVEPAPAQTEQPEQSGWISVTDRLPEPGRSHGAGVLCWREGWLQPREMKLVSNAHAKTEKGRRPRWEETRGCLAFSEPTHWMPMPAGPTQSAQGVTHGR